jgi:hypothetical protein
LLCKRSSRHETKSVVHRSRVWASLRRISVYEYSANIRDCSRLVSAIRLSRALANDLARGIFCVSQARLMVGDRHLDKPSTLVRTLGRPSRLKKAQLAVCLHRISTGASHGIARRVGLLLAHHGGCKRSPEHSQSPSRGVGQQLFEQPAEGSAKHVVM